MKNIFLNISLIFFIFLATSAFAKFEAKVTSQTITTLQQELLKAGVLKNVTQIEDLVKTFKASTAAHRLRLSEIFADLAKDPKFIKQFPEYKTLVENPSKTIEILLTHDAGKAVQETTLAVRALALLQGFDVRNPNKGLSAELDAKVRKTLKDAIDDVNAAEKKFVGKSFFDRRVNSLAEVLDYYDTYKSRQGEIAKDGRKLLKPSEWLDFLNKGKELSAEAIEINASKVKLAVFVESTDPLKNPSRFTQTADIMKKVATKPVGEIASLFNQAGKKLVAASYEARTVRGTIGLLGQGAKRMPLITIGITAAEYLISPEEFSLQKNIEDTVVSLSMSGQTAMCATIGCNMFMRECAKRIGLQSTSEYPEVMKHGDYKHCVSDFFKLPLAEQNLKRQDPDLNQILQEYSPRIHNLSCQKKSDGSLRALVESVPHPKELESQALEYNSAGGIESTIRLPDREDQIRFKDNQAVSLKHCNLGDKCKDYPILNVKQEKTYFWKDEKSFVSEKIISKIPNNSFNWAKANSSLIEMQSAKIHDCCFDSTCRLYFTENAKQIKTGLRLPAAATQSEFVEFRK